LLRSLAALAVHTDCPGLKAEVVVNGVVLKESDGDGQPPPLTTKKYVEVGSDAHFGVRYTIPKGLHGAMGVMVRLCISGSPMYRCVLTKKEIEMNGPRIIASVIVNINDAKYDQAFRFSQLRIGTYLSCSSLNPSSLSSEEDKDTLEDVSKQLQEVGQIMLQFGFIDSITRRSARQHAHDQHAKLQEFDTIAEKTLKGDVKSHYARYLLLNQ
jgi:hypothetical protein